jgi:hypothetical protein
MKPVTVPEKNRKYAKVIKNRKRKKLQKVEKGVICPQNRDKNKISTSLQPRVRLHCYSGRPPRLYAMESGTTSQSKSSRL